MKYKNLKVIAGAFALSSLVLAGCNSNEKINNEQTVSENTIDTLEEKIEILEKELESLDEKDEKIKDRRKEIIDEIEQIRFENDLEEINPYVSKNELLKFYDSVTDKIWLDDSIIKTEEEFVYTIEKITDNRKLIDENYEVIEVSIHNLELDNYSEDTKIKLNEFLISLGKIDEVKVRNVKDLGFLTNTSIEKLDLKFNDIENIEAISTVKELDIIKLDNNNISDLTPLTNLKKISCLYLSNNNISDLSALSGLTNLCLLDLDYNKITDITPLSELALLECLTLNFNEITSLNGLSKLYRLNYLGLVGNSVDDITAILPIIEKNDIEIIFDTINVENIQPIVDVIDENDHIKYYAIKKTTGF